MSLGVSDFLFLLPEEFNRDFHLSPFFLLTIGHSFQKHVVEGGDLVPTGVE
jgi:hypothetical protein